MDRLAVDVVLLPDETMTNRAIEINKRLVRDYPQEIVLDQRTGLPHISLAMGGIDETDIGAIGQSLEESAQKTAVRQLRIIGVLSSTNPRGQTTSVLEVERTDALQALHERIMRETKPFFRYEVTEDMILSDVVAPSTLDWIRNYPQKAGYEHFSPHITLGYGTLPADVSFPIPFTVTRLALCHLGNHCTCRQLLAAARMEEWNGGTVE